MKIVIKAHQLQLDREASIRMERRLHFSLNRFGTSINRVNVRLTDLNGPKGGADKECLIVVKLKKRGEVVVQGNGMTCDVALDYCAHRISRAVSRKLARSREEPIRKIRRIQNTRETISADEQQNGNLLHIK